MQIISTQYRFRLPDGVDKRFDLKIDAATLTLVDIDKYQYPDWTRLEFFQCPHCPLTPKKFKHCPLASSISPLVAVVNHLLSYEIIDVEVQTEKRTISATTSAQNGISSLMGLLIAASSCPYTDLFKPMVRFHLPFSDELETIWRAASAYLLAQHFIDAEGYAPDIKLNGLVAIYRDIETVNSSIAQRLRAASKKDSAINALVHLDVLAKFLSCPAELSMNKIKPFFAPYLRKIPQN